MLGITEIAVIAIVGAVIFFGKGQVLDWAKTLGKVKKTYAGEVDETVIESKVVEKKAVEPEVVQGVS